MSMSIPNQAARGHRRASPIPGSLFALVGAGLIVIDPGAGILVGAYMTLVGVWLLAIKPRAGLVVGSIGLLMFAAGRMLAED
jgi:hypothetical protein